VNVENFGTSNVYRAGFWRDKATARLRVRAAARYYLAVHPGGIVAKILISIVFVVSLSLFDD